jgi:hypothetical protein
LEIDILLPEHRGIEVRVMSLIFVLLFAGCQAGSVGGISLSVGSYERGLWFDHDNKEHQAGGVGMKLDILAGHMIRPVPKFWKPKQNPWKGDDPWFVIRSPMIGPFISLALGDKGVYFGFKTFEVSDKHRSLERYGKWMHESEFPQSEAPSVFMQPSATIRRTRWN